MSVRDVNGQAIKLVGHPVRFSRDIIRGTWIERSSFIGVQASHLKELVIGNFVMRLPLGPGCSST
jgi:hypothetical protein